MTQINPFVGSILQSPQAQRQQSTERAEHVRRSQESQKNSGLDSDQFEHQVESSDSVTPLHDQQKQDSRKRRKPARKPPAKIDAHNEPPGLDLTA
ncbi:MAG: hypothetical protein ACREJC_12230 [Tepidisphaeraceae bacterium]